MANDTVVQGSTTPSKRQIALELTCAILSNPSIMDHSDPLDAAEEALQVLAHLERKLRIPPTFRQQEG